MRVTYVSIARWSHDSGCHADGAKRRDEGHMSRRVVASMLVRGLKSGWLRVRVAERDGRRGAATV